jgi:hypothetical protein
VGYGSLHGEMMVAQGVAARWWSAQRDGAVGVGCRRGGAQAVALQLTHEISGGAASSPRGWRRGTR